MNTYISNLFNPLRDWVAVEHCLPQATRPEGRLHGVMKIKYLRCFG